MNASPLTAWTYPLLGAYWLASSPSLLHIVLAFLIRSTLLSVAAVVCWYAWAYPLHARVLAAVFGTTGLFGLLGRLGALGCVLGESLSAVAFLLKKRADGLNQKLFVETLRLKGVERVKPVGAAEAARLRQEVATAKAAATAEAQLQRRRLQERRKENKGGVLAASAAAALASRAATTALSLVVPGDSDGKLWRAGRSLALAPVKMLLPPVIPLLSLLEGRDEALQLNRQYLSMKGLSAEEQTKVADANSLAFRSFGAACRLLGEVPVASIAFGLSNAVAAGLWAADVEKSGGGKVLAG